MAVDAVDISRLALALGLMQAGDLPITWIELDLDLGFEAPADYDVIVNMRYVDTELVTSLIDSLRPGRA